MVAPAESGPSVRLRTNMSRPHCGCWKHASAVRDDPWAVIVRAVIVRATSDDDGDERHGGAPACAGTPDGAGTLGGAGGPGEKFLHAAAVRDAPLGGGAPACAGTTGGAGYIIGG